jgi:DNA-binding SARP family transcriptional activator
VTNLRSALRPDHANGDASAVERAGAWYRLDDSISVDVREFEAAAAEEAGAERAASLYRGHFAAGCDFTWAEAERQRLRGLAIDALTRLADQRRAAGDFAGAASALDRAIALDPTSEPLYRDLMAVQRESRREDAVRRTFARLRAALAEIDAKPDAETVALLDAGASPLP